MRGIWLALGCAVTSVSMVGQSIVHRDLQRVPEDRSPVVSHETRSPVGAPQHARLGIVSDWSYRHILYSPPKSLDQAMRLAKDPRWTQSWYLHHREAWWPGSSRRGKKAPSQTLQRDWSMSLGTVSFGPVTAGFNGSNGSVNVDPGGGELFPAKYSFDVTATPLCANQPNPGDAGDYVAIGLPATPSASQANIIGFNNLYTEPGGAGQCTGLTAPTVLFSYASGTGQVPASISLSLDGTELAYVENRAASSYFHVLKWAAGDGTDATHPIVPGAGNPSATDLAVRLTPDGTIDQNSTTSPWIDYTTDVAYVTTFSWTATDGSYNNGGGYLYKIGPIFNSSPANPPAIIWSVQVACGEPSSVPSTPVYDSMLSRVIFSDTGFRLDYAVDPNGSTTAPTVACGHAFGFDGNEANPPVLDMTNEVSYTGFNDGTTEMVREMDVTSAQLGAGGSIEEDVGIQSTFTGPYNVDFSNGYFTCDVYQNGAGGGSCTGPGSPRLYVAGTDNTTGTIPTLYDEHFQIGVFAPDLNGAFTSTALATGAADSSPVTEFFNDPDGNPAHGIDYLFVGVTDQCAATTNGGTAGCVMSLPITGGVLPVVDSSTTAIAAPGGPTGIIIDNDSTDPQASSIYYATQSGNELVKATQAALQ